MSLPQTASQSTAAIVAVDVAIIGAGPAGCSCALWLQQLGLQCALIDSAAQPCDALRGLHFKQDWVLGQPQRSLDELAQAYGAHVLSLPGLHLRLGAALENVHSRADGMSVIELVDDAPLQARAVVVATGLRPRLPEAFFKGVELAPLDAHALTRQREHMQGQRVLLLGGGDNAVENALYLQEHGNQVTLWSRSALRAAPAFVAQLQARHQICQRIAQPMPNSIGPGATGFDVHSSAYGSEKFDSVAVLFGFEPDLRVLQRFSPTASREHPWPNLFFAGDVSERLHPSIASAQADGVTCAKQVQRWLTRDAQVDAAARTQGLRILSLNGLRFAANLGILEHEKQAPQPIQVDAELHLGVQRLLPRDDEIHHVLDYRKVRKIIIDECTAEHTNLLESLIGKLSLRLMQLPGVVGVRVKIAKPEIFDDCEVSIRTEVGHW